MYRAMIAAAPLLLAAATIAAQDGHPGASMAHAVGTAHAYLMRARPCFARQDEAKLMRLLEQSLNRIAAMPGYRDIYERALSIAQTDQRYIAPSDPVACAQIRGTLDRFIRMHPAG